MIEKLPIDLQDTIKEVFDGEVKLSYNQPEKYNSFVVDAPYATSISASSRTFVGGEAVKNASINVASDGKGERNRTIEWISAECEENMAYIVFKASVEMDSISKQEFIPFAWVITIIFRKVDGEWKIAHRQNTRITK